MNMEFLYMAATLLILVTTTIFILLKHAHPKKKLMPPGPLSLPIIGHLHLLLKGPQHRLLKTLSDNYGPIIYLRFGNRPTVVISSASIAEECFTKNDIVLANRPEFLLSKLFSYNNTSISFSPYGDYWRNLRRVSTIHIFSSLSLQHSAITRAEEVRFSVRKHMMSGDKWEELNLSSFFQDLVQNVIMKMVCGKRWSNSGDVFKQIVSLASVSDYVPILRWVGFGSAEKKAINLCKQTDKFLQDIVDECRRNSSSVGNKDRKKTIVEAYLSLQEAEPDYYTDNVIKVMIQSMFTAGVDTSALTMQWAMAYLLNNPNVLEKARKEIDNTINTTEGLIEDSDLSKLPYLRCIISETLRLCPAAPLLLPHFSLEDCTIDGYEIPKGTTFVINAWAIHRDPKVWEEPMKFKPERFEGIEVGREGFKFLPFGKGRRSCPGNNLALRFVGLALGTLIQCFEWKRLGAEMVDLDETAGITMRKVKPLRGLYKPRQQINVGHLLCQLD